MRYIFFIMMLASSPLFACEIPLGKYEAITESEYSLSLYLMKNNQYQFIHKNWLPGTLHHVGEEHIYKGIYQCNKTSLTLKYNDSGKDLVGIYRKKNLKEEHFPFNKSSLVLDFSNSNIKESKIAGWTYWPESFLKQAFK